MSQLDTVPAPTQIPDVNLLPAQVYGVSTGLLRYVCPCNQDFERIHSSHW